MSGMDEWRSVVVGSVNLDSGEVTMLDEPVVDPQPIKGITPEEFLDTPPPTP